MTRLPQIALLPDGKRLHLQDGPIDLIVKAKGDAHEVRAAYEAAARRFNGLLDELCADLVKLRKGADPHRCTLKGVVARRMHAAVAPFAADCFITPMAAVAGGVAEEILGAMLRAAKLDRAYVNNGGDIALHLAPDERFGIGIVAELAAPAIAGRAEIAASDAVRGIATSGQGGRSFSLGIADAVTVLARRAAEADAAATMIANAVDLDHPAIQRRPASSLDPDSDLGELPVTVAVGDLSPGEIAAALDLGAARAMEYGRAGLILAAMLQLRGIRRIVSTDGYSHPQISRDR